MSSTTATTTVSAMDRRTYWCHECDMSISTSTTASLCPHCNSDFLDELDSPITDSNQLLFPSFLDPSSPAPDYEASDALDNPYFHRVINHLFNSDYHNPSAGATTSRLHSPASKSAIEAINSVKITSAFLEVDPIVICAVCKDQFVIDDDTKQLPCKHMYHPDCIIPWLSQRNSCPVCRFQLPTEDADGELKVRRRSRSRVLRLGDLVDDVDEDDEDEEELLGFGFRHLARRHRLVFPMRHHQSRREQEGLFSPTQIGEEVRVDVVTDSGRTNSVETVSSWPSWPVDGGEITTRVSEDDDVVMS
ncbi:hypothetical protein R6Q59_023858 [Mikania micrantha]|uniref:RING-type E3 ubiquitin transferase n=1 Tax=Mikania micrantha TaxID=192012 RepID=A0A5N6P042_9ASTR|nr:hypothetical protein E3N88_13964 [Mikania micrantha]KAD5802728.1 hypothetical protein E3N88_14088 [Mikania micrantha]